MAEVQRGHNGDSLQANDFTCRSNRTHLIIEVTRRLPELLFLLGLARDLITLIQDVDSDGVLSHY